MARCRYNLKETFMSTAPSGGTWTYNGYCLDDPAGPFDDTPSQLLFAGVNTGDNINLGDNPELPYDGKDPGFYSLTYTYSGGANDLILEILDNQICTGPDQAITISVSETNLNLESYLSAGTCSSADTSGDWVNVSGALGWSAPVFNPSVAGVGTYTFDYKLSEYDVEPCASCPDYDTRITVNVIDSFSVGITTSSSSCTKTMSIEHPDTNVTGNIKVDMVDGNNYPTFYFRNRITSSCGADVVTDEIAYDSAGSAKLILREWNPAFPGLENGGYIEYIRLYSEDTLAIDVPVAPSGVYQATFSGSAGTTNATGLTFNTVSPSVFMNSVMIAIKNYLFDVVGISSSDLDLTWDISGTNQPAFICNVRHNAPSSYVGIDRTASEFQYKPTGALGPTANVESKVDMISDAVIITPTYTDDCVGAAPLRIVTNTIPYTDFIVPNTINYDEIVTTSASVTGVTINTSHPQTNVSETCSSTTLTAVPQNCGGTTTYSWNSGETTAAITKTAGTFTVTASCDSPVSNDSDTITI